jgi:SAM-dependent methyltransferase
MRPVSSLAGWFGRWRGQANFLTRRIRNKIARTLGDPSVPPSRLALKYLRGLEGLEIGGSAHNPFGLKTKNVDFQAEPDTVFKKFEIEMCGKALPVDIVASGDDLPVPDQSQDFVISSHVIEHFFDPIKALLEWNRVIRPGGYIFVIAPHKERTFDKNRPRTPLVELIARHDGRIPRPAEDTHEHYSVWITEDFLELCRYLNLRVVDYQDVDDKVGNGFTIVVQKEGELQRPAAHGLAARLRGRRAA